MTVREHHAIEICFISTERYKAQTDSLDNEFHTGYPIFSLH